MIVCMKAPAMYHKEENLLYCSGFGIVNGRDADCFRPIHMRLQPFAALSIKGCDP